MPDIAEDFSPLAAAAGLDVVAREFPFPLAFVCQEAVMEATSPRDQAEGLIRLSNTALQYAALITASNYATAPFKDEKVSHRFERLKRPLTSDFANFLRVGVPALHNHDVLFVPELVASLEKMQGTRVRALRMGELGIEKREMGLVEALINLRNALAHDRYQGHWEAFIENHAPLVGQFLQTMDWCARYPLLRLTGQGQWIRLMGAAPTFDTETIPDAALTELARTQRSGDFTGLLLADPTFSHFLTLDPFVLWADCPFCEQEPLLGLTEEVFLFNGDEGRRYIAYAGIRHPRPMSEPKARIDQHYDDKAVPPAPMTVAQLSYSTLCDRATSQSEIWLAENVAARRYIPQVYQRRREMEAEIEAFLRARKTGFLLLGEAGMGKTNLLCHKVEAWREAGEVVLFYAGQQLSPNASLEERLMRDLHLTGDFLELLNFVRRDGRRLVLVVDGINEHENAPALLKHLCAFVTRYAANSSAHASLKVLFSFRSAFLDKTLQAIFAAGGDEASIFPAAAFQMRSSEEQGRPVETYRFPLERVDTEELEALYEGYRAFEGRPDHEGHLRRFRPRTTFASLSPAVRGVLTHPWYLRMVMEAFNDRAIPAELWTGDILRAFCDAKLYGSTLQERERFSARADLAEDLAKLMRHHQTDNFLRDNLHDLSPRWSSILLEREVAHSPYLQLVDEGVLMEVPESETVGRRTRTRYRIRFAFDPLFEYLLSNDILAEVGGAENLTGEHLAALLQEGQEFDHLTGAVELLLTEAAQQGVFRLLTDTLNAAEKWNAAPTCVRVLTTMDGLAHRNFEPLLDALAEDGEGGKALIVFVNASSYFGEKQRFRPVLACTLRAGKVGEQLVNEQGRSELANYLAGALMNKGVAQRNLGQLGEAIVSYDAAIAIRKSLVEEQGSSELANDLASALVNKGVAQSSLGQPKEAITSYDAAIAIHKPLVEEQGRNELANDLATALVNKGVAQDSLGQLREAIASYDAAIAILKPLVEEQGRSELANDLAVALMNKGNVLAQLEQWQDTANHYDAGTGLWEQLVITGMTQHTPNLLKGLGIRFSLMQRFSMWPEAATDVLLALHYAAPFFQAGSPPEPLLRAFTGFIGRLCALSPDERSQLYAALGDTAETVRELVEDMDEQQQTMTVTE